MMPGCDERKTKVRLTVWWISWATMLVSLGLIYLLLAKGRPPALASGANPFLSLIGFVPLFISIVIRWLVLPRFNGLTRALPLFIAGVALAEACGILGLFVGGPYRDALWFLGVLGVAQYVPVFARRLAEPKPKGYIPNN